MLRNTLMSLLSERDNDTVTVDIGGLLIDVESVTFDEDRGSIVLILNPDDLRETLERN